MIDYRKIINNLLEEENPRRSYAMVETLILKILTRYVRDQNKELYTNHILKNQNYVEFDAYSPLGFDDYNGATVIELKLFRRKQLLQDKMQKVVDRMLQADKTIKNLIFLFAGLELTDKEKEKFVLKVSRENINIYVWDIIKLEEIFSRYPELVLEIYNNISSFIIDTTIFEGINSEYNNFKEKRAEHIKNLRKAYSEDDLVLFLGAGVSLDARIPTWEQLISNLLVSLISKKLENYKINLTDIEKNLIISEIKKMNASSPLLQARYIRTGLEDIFTDILTEILYKDCMDNTSEILSEISQICTPVRSGTGIQAVVTYNFDDLIECNLEKARIKHRAIYREGEMSNKNELGIYHVHGFLPRDKTRYENLSKGLLVFSEEGYHNLMLDPYNWANIIQLNYLRENTCLFIGLSMTDPNLRRLLDIAVKKQERDDQCRHYVILKRDEFSKKDIQGENVDINNIRKFDIVNQSLQEEFFRELGINIIWVDKYNEIASILKQLKE